MVNHYKTYDEIGLTTDVMTASNHRLIQLLMDKCLRHVESAKSHIIAKDASAKYQSIKKAMDILDYLRICLNFKDKEAHELSSRLDAIYTYLENNLLTAQIKNDVTHLDEVKKLLSLVKEGWDGIKEEA